MRANLARKCWPIRGIGCHEDRKFVRLVAAEPFLIVTLFVAVAAAGV